VAAITQENIEASLFKYLSVNSNVPVVESPFLTDYSTVDSWIVCDPLSSVLGVQPKLLVFIHANVKNKDIDSSRTLAKLISQLIVLFEEGQPIDIYDVDSTLEVGKMRVTSPTLGPVVERSNGGLRRSLTIGLSYKGN